MGEERPDVQGVRGEGRDQRADADVVEVEAGRGDGVGVVRRGDLAGCSDNHRRERRRRVVGRVVVRLRGQVDADALVRVLDVLEARA